MTGEDPRSFFRLGGVDDHLLAAAVEIETRATQAVRPGWVALPAHVRKRGLRGQPGWTISLIGAQHDEQLVGFAEIMVADDTPRVAWLFVTVDPARQRRGVGTALTRAALEQLEGRVDEVVSRAYRPSRGALTELTERFAGRHGFASASSETVLEIDLSRGAPGPHPLPDGYATSTFVDGAPVRLRPQIGVLMGMVDADAPHGDLTWQPTPVTPEDYENELAVRREDGETTVETVVVFEDVVVAWTCVVAGVNRDRPANVEGTYVLPEHRGRRLGIAVKTANLDAVSQLAPIRVRTSSDDENVWMRRINEQLGFVPVEFEAIFRRTS